MKPPTTSELRKCLLVASERNDPMLARAGLVTAINRIAEMDTKGSVSSDCWSWIVWSDGRPGEIQGHFSDPTKESLNPTIVGPNLRADWVVTSFEPKAAVVKAADLLNAGIMGQRLDEPTMRAYLDWSPRLRSLEVQVALTGLLVDRVGYLGDVMTMIDISGLRFVTTLERHIAAAGDWADDMVREVAEKALQSPLPKPISVERQYLLELLLVGIDPDRYPVNPIPGAFAWPVTEELRAIAKCHNPKFRL